MLSIAKIKELMTPYAETIVVDFRGDIVEPSTWTPEHLYGYLRQNSPKGSEHLTKKDKNTAMKYFMEALEAKRRASRGQSEFEFRSRRYPTY